MKREWLVHRNGPRSVRRDRIHVSINWRGMVWLNRKAFDELGAPAAVELLLDERNSAMGLRPVDPDASHAYRVRSLGKSGRGLRCKQFLKDHGIDFGGTVCFPTARIEYGVLILELKYRIPSIRSDKAPKPR